MSSIWDPPDPPEVIAAERAKAEAEARAKAEAELAKMRARYAQALGCSMLSEEDMLGTATPALAAPKPTKGASEAKPHSQLRLPIRPSPRPQPPRKPPIAPRQPDPNPYASMPPALAAWRPGLPLPEVP